MDGETRYVANRISAAVYVITAYVLIAGGLVSLGIAKAASGTWFNLAPMPWFSPTHVGFSMLLAGSILLGYIHAHYSDGRLRWLYEKLGYTPDEEWYGDLEERVKNDEVPAFDGGEEVE